MNLKKDKYIILEIIPTAIHPSKGDIIQLSAIKLKGLELINRFDYRLVEDKIPLEDFKKMISFDKENFNYLNTTEEILNSFAEWSDNLPLLIIDNRYTKNFLSDLSNTKESIATYLDMDYNELRDDFIERLIQKYDIAPTNYIVDILYESLIKYL